MVRQCCMAKFRDTRGTQYIRAHCDYQVAQQLRAKTLWASRVSNHRIVPYAQSAHPLHQDDSYVTPHTHPLRPDFHRNNGTFVKSCQSS